MLGKVNLIGNIEPGTAVLDQRTGQTLYKLPHGITTALGLPANVINIESMTMELVKTDREVWPMSEKISEIIKAEILNTPGYRGMLI